MRFSDRSYDFNDLLGQMGTMRKLAPIENIVRRLPGVGRMLPEAAIGAMNQRSLNRVEAILLSMTPEERTNPDVLDGSRRTRIAQGSGTSIEEVNALVRQLYVMRGNM
jgi:signal recognition particle subunit SRP54